MPVSEPVSTSERAAPPSNTAGVVGLVSALGTALGLGGCQNQDPCEGLRTFDPPPEPQSSATAPPTVLDGEWIGAGVLELQFSKPLDPGTPPDPTRLGVLGWAAQVQDYNYGSPGSCYVRTRYGGLGLGYYQSSSVADVWVAPEDPSILRLRMSNASADCRTVPDTVAEGVMLVYVDGGPSDINRLFDAEGDPVPDIGPAWAIPQLENCVGGTTYYYYYNPCGFYQTATGHLPSITTLADIPCPS